MGTGNYGAVNANAAAEHLLAGSTLLTLIVAHLIALI